MGDFIRIDFDEMEDSIGAHNKLSNDVVNSSETMQKNFSAATNIGVLTKNVKVASEGMDMISEAIANTGKIIKQHTQSFYEYDKELANRANGIAIPQDFLNENAMEINKYNYSILNKIDGKSVNDGEAQGEAKDIDESVVAAQGLADITKDDTKEQKLDESTVIGKSVLGNIVKDETKAQEYDETSSVQARVLGDVNNGNNQVEQELDESTVIGRSVLGNVNSQAGVAAAAAADYSSSMEQEKERKVKEEQMKNEEELVRPDFDELIPSDK